jgi:hypothetical protein
MAAMSSVESIGPAAAALRARLAWAAHPGQSPAALAAPTTAVERSRSRRLTLPFAIVSPPLTSIYS